MVVYYGLMIWTFICKVMSGFMGSVYNEKAFIKEKVPKGLAFFCSIFFVLVAGLRSGIGDTWAYIKIFDDLPNTFSLSLYNQFDKDVGFFMLSTLFKQYISKDYHVWFFVIACITGYFIIKTLYKYSDDFYLSLFLFVATLNFIWMINGMRQFLAVAIIFGNIDLIIDRKFLKYFILVMLCSTIHITAVVAILLYFAYDIKPFGASMLIMLVILILVGLSVDTIAQHFSIFLEDSAYEGYLDSAAGSAGSNILRFIVGMAPVFLAFVGRKFVDNKIIGMSINLSAVAAAFYFISSFSGGVLIGRIPVYFDMFNLILLPWIINHMFEVRSKHLMKILIIICYFVFFYMKAKYGMQLGYESNLLGIQVY